MAYAAQLSFKTGLCSKDDGERVINLIKKAELPTAISDLDTDTIIESLYLDKKIRDERVRFVLMNGIGAVGIYSDISHELIRRTILN